MDFIAVFGVKKTISGKDPPNYRTELYTILIASTTFFLAELVDFCLLFCPTFYRMGPPQL
jgi:hypothetical protein